MKKPAAYQHFCGRVVLCTENHPLLQPPKLTPRPRRSSPRNVRRGERGKYRTRWTRVMSAPGRSDKVIDLKNRTVMPGLIDSHVHLEDEFSAQSQLLGFTMGTADIAFRSTVYARTTLMAGFTTVRDVGGTGVNIALRNAIRKGTVVGPRVYTAGKILSSTGGHGDPTHGYREGLYAEPSYTETVCDGKESCIKAVRQMYKEGADLIKESPLRVGCSRWRRTGWGRKFSDERVRNGHRRDGSRLRYGGRCARAYAARRRSKGRSVRG